MTLALLYSPLKKATFIALYLGVFSCLYVWLWHSSTIINPILLSGTNIALLAPTTSDTSWFIILLYSSYFSPSLRELWNTATEEPNTDLNLETICGVKDISGTNTIPVLPSLIVLFNNSI